MPQIFSALRQAWRSGRCLQLGTAEGVLLDGLDARDELLIIALRTGASRASYLRRAGELGVAPARAESLLALLQEARALIPEEPSEESPPPITAEAHASTLLHYRCGPGELLRRRGERSVAVFGEHELTEPLVARLREAGVVGAARSTWRGGRAPEADLAVLLARDAIDPLEPENLLRADRPHLAITTRETDVVVGPLVVPGSTACLRCVELARSDADPDWPLLLAQLCAARGGVPPMDPGLALSALGTALLQILCHLDGRATPSTHSASITVSLPDGAARLDPIAAHPDCGCLRPPSSPSADDGADRAVATRLPRPAVVA